MKRRFILAFVALFALFAAGITTSLIFIWRGSTELQRVVEAHQVEELRQHLSQRLGKSQQDLQVSNTVFANELDDIIANVQALDRSVESCFNCHHEPALQERLATVSELVKVYKDQYSTFITAFLNPENRQRLQLEAATTANEIDAIVDSLLLAAGPALRQRTEAAMTQVGRSWQILWVTLLLTFVVAIVISSLLTTSVTQPLQRLVSATGRIAGGELSFRIRHQEKFEVGVLMDAFNTMSETLEAKTKRIESHVERLHRLNEVVVSLHQQPGEEVLFGRVVEAIDTLMDVELRGNILPTGLEDVFLVALSERGETLPRYTTVVSAGELERIRGSEGLSTLMVGEEKVDGWPVGRWPLGGDPRNYLACWITCQGELCGALLAVNKVVGDFEEEDAELFTALGNGVGVALENARKYQNLRAEMELLKSRAEPDEPV